MCLGARVSEVRVIGTLKPTRTGGMHWTRWNSRVQPREFVYRRRLSKKKKKKKPKKLNNINIIHA